MRFKKRKVQAMKTSAFLHPKKCKTTRKTSFADEKAAGRSLTRIWSRDPSADLNDLHTYQCPDCKLWHIGHRSKYKMKLEREHGITAIQSNLP